MARVFTIHRVAVGVTRVALDADVMRSLHQAQIGPATWPETGRRQPVIFRTMLAYIVFRSVVRLRRYCDATRNSKSE